MKLQSFQIKVNLQLYNVVTLLALRLLFPSQHGKVKEIRMVTQRSGKFKGLAYIEYEDAVSQ